MSTQRAAIILAGGKGSRLGGVSKADLDVGGRLLDRLLGALTPLVDSIVVVAPETVAVPPGVVRTLENPPGGGPLAGIAAGLMALGGTPDSILVTAVDTPGTSTIAAELLARLESSRADAVVTVGGHGAQPTKAARHPRNDDQVAEAPAGIPGGVDQFLQAAYRGSALTAALDATRAARGSLHNASVRRTLDILAIERIPSPPDVTRDIDTPQDLAAWRHGTPQDALPPGTTAQAT